MPRKPKKIEIRKLLVECGVFADASEAERWIMAGDVIANDRRIDKPGERVPEDAEIRIRGRRKYVGRGGEKLEGALRDLEVDVTGRVALDAGASTGGFTDCLLQHGVARVYAVDVGYGMLAGTLRSDDRVVVFERTNIGSLTPNQLDPLPSLATMDLSYLSLKEGIPIVAKLVEAGGEMVCLVKPLFEIEDADARRKGEIPDPSAYLDILNGLIEFVRGIGLHPAGLCPSRLPGTRGTREFFLHVSLRTTERAADFDVPEVVRAASGLGNGRP
jgi:23S rRNA (cytidine1920-2'-O)/16S rRNA (cytidine1409-2'-O)-methyltransferase